jgi:hypothetical protein
MDCLNVWKCLAASFERLFTLGLILLKYGDMPCRWDFCDWNCLAASSKSWNMLKWIVWISGNAWPHPLSVCSRLATSYWNMVTCHEGEIFVTGTAWPHPLRVEICLDGLSECLEMLGRILWAFVHAWPHPTEIWWHAMKVRFLWLELLGRIL